VQVIPKKDGIPVNSGLQRFGHAVAVCTLLAISCLISFSIIANILSREYIVSRDNELLGGMWAAIATIFVFRQIYVQSARAALTRTLAIELSFILCLAYFLVLPFHVVGIAIVIGVSSIILTFARRTEDTIAAGITAGVVFVVSGISPGHGWWIQPILRLADTAVGILVGLAASWISLALGLSSASRTEA